MIDPPGPFRVVAHEWIPLGDGRRLAARLYLPEDAETHPVPALLELHPYGSRGPRAIGDLPRHGYLAGHGYACARVDLAGSGESDGLLADEYLSAELDDAVEVIAWLAARPWCNGAVGMFGISWGGFNSLAVAARRPPALRAIVSACASDDRYADDVHYYGGCVVGLEMLSWSTTMLALTATPPDPTVLGETWRQPWRRRIENAQPMVEAWLAHQRRDAYWRESSLSEDYSKISCPTLLIGGWADAYRDGTLRLLAGLTAPARAIIGPWGHAWPDHATPGPEIGVLDEMLRWWDRWLKGRDTGVLDEPPLRAWLQDAVRPAVAYPQRPGRWTAEAWPPPPRATERLPLGNGTLGAPGGDRPILSHRGRLTPASEPGPWCAAGRTADFPDDQQGEDGQCLAFTSEPIDDELAILGPPALRLRVAADKPVALVAVRLCDVWPDGASTLVTRGALNLTHRAGHDTVRPLTPGQTVDVTVPLQATGYVVPVGHSLRVTVSSAYWPLLWPSPELATLQVDTSASELVVPLSAAAERAPTLPDVRRATTERFDLLPGPALEASTQRWPASGKVEIVWPRGAPGVRLADDTEYHSDGYDSFVIVEGNPTSAEATSLRSFVVRRHGREVHVEARGSMRCTADEFILDHGLDVTEDGTAVTSRQWQARVARDGG
jgi:putative CocE/NonD family hydrolase